MQEPADPASVRTPQRPDDSLVSRYLTSGAPPIQLNYLSYLFEHVADVVFFLEVLEGERYRFAVVNRRFAETTGLPPTAVIGKEVDEVIPAPSLALVKSKYREAIASGAPVHWREESAYPTGTKTGEVTVSPVVEEDGCVRFLMGVVHDITEHVADRRALSGLEERWRLALEYAGAGAWEWQAGTGMLSVFPGWQDIAGTGFVPMPARRDALPRWLHPDDLHTVDAALAAVLAGRAPRLDVEGRVRHQDGHWVWIRVQGKLVKDAGGKPLRMLGIVTDVSADKAVQQELALGALVFRNSHEAIAIVDPDGRILTVNPAFTAMRGYSAEEIAGKAPRLYDAGLDDAGFYDALWARLRATGQWHGELWSRHKDGHVIAEYRTIMAACDADGKVRNYIEIGTDITETKKAEEFAWRKGNYDPLTGLPNRQLFLERLGQAIAAAQGDGGVFTLLVIDLDHFKEVNETLGHSTGDLLLKEAAQRLLDRTREGDTVARLGGDEFVVLLGGGQRPHGDEACAIDRIAQDIVTAMATPFEVDGEVLHLSASIGITHYPRDATDLDNLVKHADQAMYVAKQQGRNRYAYFSHAMQERAQARRQLIKDLRAAIAEHRLDVHYQPIVNLANGMLEKAESLIRWRHPQRGPVSPAEFVPLSEETGLVRELGAQTFETVVRDMAAWRCADGRPLQVSINVSPVQLLAGYDACAQLFRLAREAALPEGALVIEVTESMLLDDNVLVTRQLRQIAEHGMRLALDDFGTGYSSLAYLKKFAFHFLKIDRAFVTHLEADTTDYALCEAIITMAHKLGMKVIAEGLETPAQMRLLRQAGCDYGQGYLFSPAVPAQEMAAWCAHGDLPWLHAPGLGFPG